MTNPHANKRITTRVASCVLGIAALTAAVVVVVLWWRESRLAKLEQDLGDGSGESTVARRVLADVDGILARQPGSQRALSLKARALVALGHFEEACHVFSQISVRAPEEIRAYANALVHRRRWREAIPMLVRLLEINPDDPVALRHLATSQFQLGQAEAARESAARLAKIQGHEVEGLFLSGVLHRADGNTELALENWAKIELRRPMAEGLPIPPAEFYLTYGEDLLSEGKPRLARLKLEQSRQFEENVPVLLQLGKVNSILGNHAEATTAWQRAIDQDPNNEMARNGLAELAMSQGNPAEALQWLRPIAERPEVSSATAYLMERAHTLLGNDEDLERWQRQTAALRKAEKLEEALKRKLGRS